MPSVQNDSSSRLSSRWWSLSVASVATLIVTLDTGQLSIALPLIIKDFDADMSLASWIELVYALITACPQELLAYVEAKAIVGGTTTIQGSPPKSKPRDGWLVRVRLSDPSEVERLLDAASYRELLE